MADVALEREALALLDHWFELAPAEREAWLKGQTAGRPVLAARVRALLAALAADDLKTGGALNEVDLSPLPERIGPYRITGLIGVGGMGSVYRGERDRGDFEHVVAIKAIKPGLLSERLVERFLAERQTLAGLNHPGIARLYGGGEIDGAPYIVMEFIDGLPLLEWAARHDADRPTRCRLFRDICDAVAAAHRSLIVHRDLTPSNVLVTAAGEAKLIDFGIARPAAATDDAPALPSLASLSLTPGYAAPERMVSAAVTTSADIYSLGRILEHLIPPGPADRELAAIAARATADRPEDRYPTVDALSRDLSAWERNLPVQAFRGGRRYLIGKFVARNRAPVLASAAGVLLLVVALGVSATLWLRAERARAAEVERFGQVRTLANTMLGELDGRLSRVPGNTAARGALASEADRYLRLLAQSRDAPPSLRIETARGMIRLAEIQGVPGEPNLGQSNEAARNLRLADEILAGLVNDRPELKIDRARIAAHQSSLLLHAEGHQAEAQKRNRSAEGLLATVPPAERTVAWHETRRLTRNAAFELADIGDNRAALPALVAQARRDRETWPAELARTDAGDRDEALARYYEALFLLDSDLPRAVNLHLANEAAYDALLARSPNDPQLLLRAASNGYRGFQAASRLAREDVSSRLIVKSGDVVARLAAIDDRDDATRTLQANIREAYAQNLRDLDRFADAIALQQQVVADRRKSADKQSGKGKTLGNLGFSQMILGVIARDAGNRPLACASWRDANNTLAEGKRRNVLVGFHAGFIPGIEAHVVACDNGQPIDFPMR